jgi:hypothetical protein
MEGAPVKTTPVHLHRVIPRSGWRRAQETACGRKPKPGHNAVEVFTRYNLEPTPTGYRACRTCWKYWLKLNYYGAPGGRIGDLPDASHA